MVSRSPRQSWALALLLLAGCCYPVRDHVDLAIQGMANRPIDPEPFPAAGLSMPYAKATSRAPGSPGEIDTGVTQVAAQEQPRPGALPQRPRPLTLPPGLPGSEAPEIELPPLGTPGYQERKNEVLRRFYPPLPPVGPDVQPQPGPEGRPLTLADLQHLAVTNSPLIRQAAADVEAARGAAIQAGAYPNPNMGYEADTVGTSSTAGFQGAFIDQLIKTAGKLKLAWAAAQMDLLNAQLALRRAQTDVMAQVRSGYFAVLVAQENIRINRILVQFTDEVFRLQLVQARYTAAAYEPMGLRVLAYQARAGLLQARNRYTSAWKQLAAAVGQPALPPTELAGRVDMPVPVYDFDKVLARVLSSHTDVATAQNTLMRARYNLRLAQVTPVPDVDLRLLVQKDFSMPPFAVTHSVQVTMPIPVWNTNRGGIIQAQGQLLRGTEEAHRVRDDLTTRLADAFERYENNRRLVEYYEQHILPDQVRFYKGVYRRYMQGVAGDVNFSDIVTAQQTLVTAITTYITTLGLQWQAVVDVASLLQTNDLFQMGDEAVEAHCVAPVPDLGQLLALPCCHPSSPLPDPRLKGPGASWPPAIPAPDPNAPRVEPVLNGTDRSSRSEPGRAGPEKKPGEAASEVEVLTGEQEPLERK